MKSTNVILPNGMSLVHEIYTSLWSDVPLVALTAEAISGQWYLEGELELPQAQAIKLYEKGLAHTVRLDLRCSRPPRTLAGVRLPIRDIAAFRILRHVMELANG